MKTIEIFKFHQALHGYDKGHQQLAISRDLDPKDQRALLSLSDISGSGMKLDSSGYLTGYPLHASGCYALSKTWPAPEMPRPGCVWTHTLLIEFSDLAIIDSLLPLLELFKQPSKDSISLYRDPLTTHNKFKHDHTLPYMQDIWSHKIVASLYKSSEKTVVAARLEAKTEEKIVNIWSQQWPRLRRNFLFCTFSISDRKLNGKSFDLQITPVDNKALRNIFPNSTDSALCEDSKEPWEKVACEDLINPDKNGLRTFFRKTASDVEIGRDGFILLSKAFLALEKENAHDLVRLFENQLKGHPATHARVLSTTLIAKKIDQIDSATFEFFWNNINFLPKEILKDNHNIVGLEVWRRAPSKLISLLGKEQAELSSFSLKTLMAVPLDELAEEISKTPGIQQDLIDIRPNVLTSPEFWKHLSLKSWSLSIPVDAPFEKAIMAAFNAEKPNITEFLVGIFGLYNVLHALNKMTLTDQTPKFDFDFINTSHSQELSNFLCLEINYSILLIKGIAKNIHPDFTPILDNKDPWLNTLTRIEKGQLKDDIFLCSFAFSRALGSTTCEWGRLASLSFDTLHAAAYSSRIDRESWELFESKLLPSFFSWDWDRCKRLRDTTTNLFVKRDIPPAIFLKLTNSEYLFKELLNSLARVKHGKRYIRKLVDTIKENPNSSNFSVESVIRILDIY